MRLIHLETRGVRIGESWRPQIVFVEGGSLNEHPCYRGVTRCDSEEEAEGFAFDILRGGLDAMFIEVEREHWQRTGKEPHEFFVQQVADHLTGEEESS